MGLGLIPAILDDRVRRAVGAHHAIGPAHGPNRLVAFGVVDEILDVYHGSTARAWETVRVEGTGGSTKRSDYNDSEADPNHHPAIHLEPPEIARVKEEAAVHARLPLSIQAVERDELCRGLIPINPALSQRISKPPHELPF